MNPLDISALPFPGGTVDASTFQPLAGPTSRSVPWTDPLADVAFPALATASRLAVLVDAYETIMRDELPAAAEERDWNKHSNLCDEVNEYWDELRGITLRYGAYHTRLDGLSLVCGRVT